MVAGIKDQNIYDMKAEELRERHTTFTYRGFDIHEQDKKLGITYHFKITPNIEFSPSVVIPVHEEQDQKQLSNFIFHLGMIEAVSYWKSTCSPNLVVEAGNLTDRQVSWWHDLFVHGLGEFYYQNNIDFSDPNFLNIESLGKVEHFPPVNSLGINGYLIMVGGGKDAVVTLETLGNTKKRKNVLLLNPTKAAKATAEVAGFHDPIIVERTIDKKLLELNSEGYLNGHTPFSAYLSFLGILAGSVNGYKHVIASNESSAGEGSVAFHQVDVNHQYSKSYRYERLFRDYTEEFLTKDVSYFSFLRPLYELQIAALFSTSDKYDQSFCSCNMSRNEFFCGKCPKCAFVYLSLTPFIDQKRINAIFGELDYFEKTEIQTHIIDLVGLGEHKPFDCVGTEEESRLAVALALYTYEQRGQDVPNFLRRIRDQLNLTEEYTIGQIKHKIRTDWNEHHFLPKEYQKTLRQRLEEL